MVNAHHLRDLPCASELSRDRVCVSSSKDDRPLQDSLEKIPPGFLPLPFPRLLSLSSLSPSSSPCDRANPHRSRSNKNRVAAPGRCVRNAPPPAHVRCRSRATIVVTDQDSGRCRS